MISTHSRLSPISVPVTPVHFSVAVTVQIWMAVDINLLEISFNAETAYWHTMLLTTASGPGPREEKEAACSYISSDSSLLHTYDPYGRRTMCCARSSLQPKLCSQKCAPYDASSTPER